MSTPEILSPSEYRKRKLPERDEHQMLLAVNSRYEDRGGRRVHIMPELDGPIFIRERKKITGLHVPSTDAITLDLLEEYGCVLSMPLWLRAPFILPNSWAPWSLEPGRAYLLASRQWSTPYPGGTARQAHWQWCLDNLGSNRQFLPHALPELARDATEADLREINVRLWDDARGPGSAARRAEIQAIALRVMPSGRLEEYAPILPSDREELHRPAVDEGFRVGADARIDFLGWEEAVWAAQLDDPDIDLFGLDVEESAEWDTTKNLFLESDNLLALKRLRRGYDRKVKLTYIDPPYNTGNQFVYNDDFKTAANTGSPFLGQRWARGTWLHCRLAPWFNRARLAPKKLLEVDDTMLYPRVGKEAAA